MARVSREAAAAHRTAIVRAAGRLFRERGFERVGVAEITREAGLTHGGFYGHFASKEALAAEALAAAFAESRMRLDEGTLESWVKAYLSRAHRDGPEEGCPIPMLAADATQAGGLVGETFAEGVAELTRLVAERLDGGEASERRARAATLLATLVGGLTLARSLAVGDRAASDALLRDLRRRALDLIGP